MNLEHFKQNLTYFNVDSHMWIMCLLGDSFPKNLEIARLINSPNIGCDNHKLRLKVNAMLESDVELKRVTDSVSETM